MAIPGSQCQGHAAGEKGINVFFLQHFHRIEITTPDRLMLAQIVKIVIGEQDVLGLYIDMKRQKQWIDC